MQSLDEVLSARRLDDVTDALTVHEGWGQGKATFGGLVVGACVRSMAARVTDPKRRLRTISAQLLGAPRPGDVVIRVRLLRTSATVTTFCADLEQDGQVMTHVVAVFGLDRPVPLSWNQVKRPEVPEWASVEPAQMEGFAPEFTKHFEFRNVGAIPYTETFAPSVGFIRPRTPSRVRDEAWLACMTDCWWLAAITHFDTFRPAATLTLNAEFHEPMEGLDPEAPLLHHGASLVVHHGYSAETRTLWGIDGRLLVTATELVTVIK
ncbi:MAG: thioesterase family protein [Archangiaceae bacterium]|nr:thioesterase family protein [Archangiaceae bacterium]